MNANEVIAALASARLGRRVHPNDHVNASQSSNDVFPSAIALAATRLLARELIPALDHLAAVLEAKAAEFAANVKVGRTHLMDAVPVTLGQEFGGYAAAIRLGTERTVAVLPRLGELPLGGTATGTGLNAPPGFAARVIERLASDLGLPLTEARNLLASARLLAAVLPLLAHRCVAGITAFTDRMRRAAESSPVIVTALNRYLGYEAAAQVAHEALESGQTIRSVVISRGHVDRGEISLEQLDAALDVLAMTGERAPGDERA